MHTCTEEQPAEYLNFKLLAVEFGILIGNRDLSRAGLISVIYGSVWIIYIYRVRGQKSFYFY